MVGQVVDEVRCPTCTDVAQGNGRWCIDSTSRSRHSDTPDLEGAPDALCQRPLCHQDLESWPAAAIRLGLKLSIG
jgi:hypothetical protein